jgi:predicted P-loop ATPase
MNATKPKHEGAEAWRNHLHVSNTGAIKPIFANAVVALHENSSWVNTLAFDAFAQETIVDRAPPWANELEWIPRAWVPHDDLLLTNWLQQQGINGSPAVAAQAVEMVARERSFHPVLDHLNSLQHDGTFRLDSWLATHLGAEKLNYNKIVGRSMLIAAVARVRNPGCKVDTVPIFEGAQSIVASGRNQS